MYKNHIEYHDYPQVPAEQHVVVCLLNQFLRQLSQSTCERMQLEQDMHSQHGAQPFMDFHIAFHIMGDFSQVSECKLCSAVIYYLHMR